MKPQRIQRKRTKGWRMPENTVSVTRPGKWGNPFKIGDIHPHAAFKALLSNHPEEILNHPDNKIKHNWQCVELYEQSFHEISRDRDLNLDDLRGKNLACFCKEGEPCHADVLLELANS